MNTQLAWAELLREALNLEIRVERRRRMNMRFLWRR